MGKIHEETALRLERLENIISRWEDYYAARKDAVTAAQDSGQVEAYAHCRGMIKRFADALTTGDETGLADELQDMEDEATDIYKHPDDRDAVESDD